MPRRPPRDRPGPRPENQRKRQEVRGPRHALVGVLTIAAFLAALGVLQQIADRRALVVICVTQALGAWLLLGRHPRGRIVAVFAALFAIGWGVAQILIFDGVSWFSLSLLGVGALEALLAAGATPRGPHEKNSRR